MDDVERVLAVSRDHDAADHFTLPVQFGDASALVRHQLDASDVAQEHGRTRGRLDDQPLEIASALQVASSADDVFRLRHLDDTPADVLVTHADDVAHLPQRDAIGLQLLRIDGDLVGLDETTDARNLRYALGLGELIAHEPVLDRAQFRERTLRALNDVLIDPADASRIRPEGGRDAARQAARGEVEVLEHARACPVDVRAVLKDHVDERDTEVRETTHHLGTGHGQHGGGQRISDLVLDHLRALPGVFGVDDDLHVGQIRQRVDGRMDDRVDACGHNEARRQ